MKHSTPVSSAASPLDFTLRHWCLWQSGPTPATATVWPGGQTLPNQTGTADVNFLPMLQRRRLSPLARAACAVAWHCRLNCGDMPAVFFSCHGESQYYLEILSGLASDGSVSPSRFSLCVHNAIGGLHSLHSESLQAYVSLAGGSEGFFTPFPEAAGLLLETPQVLIVWYEQPLPAIYQAYLARSGQTWALAMVLSKAGQPGPQLQLLREAKVTSADSGNDESDLVQAILSNRRSGRCRLERSHWHWNLTDG
ncbi:beta-ketoacyl synthase chain length factor [Methylomonas methanica]|uniref:Beta-ketoacyl synthase-like N-terminal domain-containing protein n=1 Tax=Methylomonas methanica (strain DSM 25384 / MC09) TaxID=857087 RepID=G0A1B0_METMM|nr:beta-ketoacyl synthase chain length factor [Methylomonas methanica]AEG02530.1 hypothetical protein Metme_4179 [Methylomonas methanica MC09]